MAMFRPCRLSVSALRMTGTTSPSSTATATPTLTALRRQWPSSVQWALRSGCLRSASTQALVTNAT